MFSTKDVLRILQTGKFISLFDVNIMQYRVNYLLIQFWMSQNQNQNTISQLKPSLISNFFFVFEWSLNKQMHIFTSVPKLTALMWKC